MKEVIVEDIVERGEDSCKVLGIDQVVYTVYGYQKVVVGQPVLVEGSESEAPVRGAGKTTGEALMALGLVVSHASETPLSVPLDVAKRMIGLVEVLQLEMVHFTYSHKSGTYFVGSGFKGVM